MKLYISTICVLVVNSWLAKGQSPVPLRPDISITEVMTIHPGTLRIAYNNIDSSFYCATISGNIYKVNLDVNGLGTDTLLYTKANHGIDRMQGMAFYDSCLYVSGNLQPDSPLTTGIIMRGKLLTGYQRNWTTVAQTVPYETANAWDHYFSGLTVNLSGDTLFLCSGSRGDHGEVETRNGMYPGLRNLPVTSVILQIPTIAINLIIPNDSLALDQAGLVLARGIRNTFDFAYNAAGDLFGAENSCDRDMEDELNWLRPGKYYGFPWMMGGAYNPQQFAGYDPTTDSLLNHNSLAWLNGAFHNDPSFPQIPTGLQLTMPCKNLGPDASFLRNSITGVTYNAAAIGDTIYSFTPHRSPLGLTFDRDSILGSDLRGNGFVLSYTRGDSTLNNASPLLVPFNDKSEDLLMLKMEKDTADDTYLFHAYKIAEGFLEPVDAVLLDTNMYIIEFGFSGTESLWRINFPVFITSFNTLSKANNPVILVYPNPASNIVNFSFNSDIHEYYNLGIYDMYNRLIFFKDHINSKERFILNTSQVEQGIYCWKLSGEFIKSGGRFAVMH
ncbi:MAG: T9SS type A sorting domain-containing protein [Bacteroidia bacterium]